MRKKLLLTAALLGGFGSLFAIEPQIYPDFLINWISSGGKWAGTTYYGDVAVINLETGEVTPLVGQDEEGFVSPGLGNYLSDNGIFVGGATYEGEHANYWKDGEWGELPTGSKDQYSNFSQGVTADGSRICGQVGRTEFSLEAQSAMSTPVVWYANADGGYDPYIELPHPGVDIEGLVPQYVTAVAISDDGKKIVGQVRSNSGRYNVPIMYQEQEDGSWEYRYLWPFSLEGVELPTPPGEKPEAPVATDFMDPETAEQYLQIVEETGDYPDVEEWMTDEEYEAWLAAWDEYFILDNQWWIDYAVYVTAMEDIINVPGFEFNNIMMSANGRYVVSTELIYDEFTAYCNVYICDTENDDQWTMVQSSDLALLATYVSNEGYILAATPSYDTFRRGYIYRGQGSFVPIEDYIKPLNGDLYDWMDENMRHDHYNSDYEWVENDWCTGTMCASADLSIIASWEANAWDETAESYYYSYILPISGWSGVASKIADENAQADGPVFNLQGIKVAHSIDDASLPAGIYILNGKKISKK